MKTNSISFGATYFREFNQLSEVAKEKVGPIIAIGNSFPYDLFIKTQNGKDLSIALTRANPIDIAIEEGCKPPADENLQLYILMKMMDMSSQRMRGQRPYPIEKFIIKDFENKTHSELVNKIINSLYDYKEKYAELFIN